MTKSTLKLTMHDDGPSDILPFERRTSPRRAISGQVTTLVSDDDAIRRFSSLSLLDISETGLCAISEDAIELNSNIMMLFQPHGPEGGYDTAGEVIRCIATSQGYEIGIRFGAQAVAA